MRSWKEAILWGIAIWLVPFIISVPLYSPAGALLIDANSFKTLMVIAGAAIGAVACVMYFRKVEKGFQQEGVQVGLLWLLINWAIDLAILVPMAHLSIPAYLNEIGLRYLSIPMTTIAIGALMAGLAGRAKPAAKPKGRK